MPADATEFALQYLKATTAVTDLLVEGASSIFESGDLDMTHLGQIETARRTAGTLTKLLAIVVQDAGESVRDEGRHSQRVMIYLYDRQRGYTNIRTVRRQVYLALQGRSTSLTAPYQGRTVMNPLLFEARTGHVHERSMALDFEAMTFSSEVHLEAS